MVRLLDDTSGQLLTDHLPKLVFASREGPDATDRLRGQIARRHAQPTNTVLYPHDRRRCAATPPAHGHEFCGGAGTRRRTLAGAWGIIDAWIRGRKCTLGSDGHVTDAQSTTRLSDVTTTAEAARQLMAITRASRPGGEIFKVNDDGVMVTLVDERPRYVATVTSHKWFPSHLGHKP